MQRILFKSGIRYLLRHKLQFGLSVLGIAIGVAIITAIDIANFSTSKAFNISMNAISGKATHRIISSSGGIPDSLYRNFKTGKKINQIAPLVEEYAVLNDSVKRVFVLLGIDVFAERPFRDYFSSDEISLDGVLKDILTKKNTVAVSDELAASLKKNKGDTISVYVNGKPADLILAAIIKNYTNKTALENLLLTDISTAQELAGKNQTIDAIDVIASTDEEISYIKSILPENLILQRSAARSDVASQMLSAFNVNLTALSLLALIVGVFLIYNTVTFSVVRRKILIGTFRSLGVTGSEIYRLIIYEVLIVGIIGTAAGFFLGIVISKNLLVLITRTINDLYFVVNVTDIEISGFVIFKAFAVGVIASVLSGLKPAYEASRTQPGISLLRSEQERSIIKKIPYLTAGGILSGIIGYVMLSIPSKSVWLGYGGVLPVIIGFSLLTPLAIYLSVKILTPLLKKAFGFTGSISSGSILKNISRTNAAIASLGIAVAATVGVSTMINSFRSTVIDWLETGLQADMYISTPGVISNINEPDIPAGFIDSVLKIDGVTHINFYSEFNLIQDTVQYNLVAFGYTNPGDEDFHLDTDNPDEAKRKFYEGELLVSEPFAFKNNVEEGSVMNLKTDNGYREFRVGGVYYDYSSDKGFITVEYSHFKKHWNLKGLSGIGIYVSDESKIENVKNSLLKLGSDDLKIIIRTNKFLKQTSVEIFDRTFLVANVLQLLSVMVAFIGILSSLMALQLERGREMAVLRSVGLLPGQLFRIINLQSLLMGLIAGIISLPLGSILAAILVYIINRRSFGWTMQFEIELPVLLNALLISVAASMLAGIYPGYKMSKTLPSAALRNE